jgi:hypothetical protein
MTASRRGTPTFETWDRICGLSAGPQTLAGSRSPSWETWDRICELFGRPQDGAGGPWPHVTVTTPFHPVSTEIPAEFQTPLPRGGLTAPGPSAHLKMSDSTTWVVKKERVSPSATTHVFGGREGDLSRNPRIRAVTPTASIATVNPTVSARRALVRSTSECRDPGHQPRSRCHRER